MALYNEEGGGGSGVATAPEAAPAESAAPQPSGAAPANPAPAPEASAKSDAEIVDGAREKLKKDPTYRLSSDEAKAFGRHSKAKGQPAKAEATPAPAAPATAPVEIPSHLKAAMDRLKVQKPEDLPGSVEKLQQELQRLNGERGNLGPLQERVQKATGTIETQQAIIRDIIAGKPEALEWARKNAQMLGLDPATIKTPQAPAQQPQGEHAFDPAAFLDPDLAKFANEKYSALESKLAAALERIDQLSQNTEKYGKFYETELEKQGKATALEGAMGAIQTLLDTDGVSGIYDRRHGAMRPHMEAFFQRGEVNDYNRGIVEVLRIANEVKAENLQDAFYIWQGRNRGKLAVAAKQATPQAPALAPTVGLSDRQEGNGGRNPTGPSASDVIDWLEQRKPIPAEFIKNGRLQTKMIPSEVMAEVRARRGR
jgi:hypothetical protein